MPPGATDWIRFAGRVERRDLVAEYRRAWLVVSGSLAEGWGLSLTEAAACGTPAVATDIRGHRSSVVDGVTGVLVEPDELGHDDRRRATDEPAASRLAAGGADAGPHADVGRLGARYHRRACTPPSSRRASS